MSPFYTTRKLIIGLVFLLAIFSFFVWYSYRNMNAAVKETRTVNSTLHSLRAFEDIMDDAQDIENSERGYLMSGNEEFLKPYYAAIKELATDTLEFKTLYPLFPERTAALSKLLRLVGNKASLADSSISRFRQQPHDLVSLDRISKESAGVMNNIRELIGNIEKEDRIVLNQSNDQRQSTARNTGRIFIALALVFIIGLFMIFWRVTRGFKLRDQYEKRIAYLAGLTEKTSDAIFSTDTNLVIKTWNKAAADMYGYSPEEAIGQKVESLLQVNRPAEVIDTAGDNLNRLGYYKDEYEAIKKSGEHIDIQASVSVLRNEKSVHEGYVTVHRDITDKKKAEQLLKSFNKELARQVEEKTLLTQNILERINDGFYSLDDHWNFTYMNKTAAMMMNCDPQEIIGKNLWKEFPEAAGLSI